MFSCPHGKEEVGPWDLRSEEESIEAAALWVARPAQLGALRGWPGKGEEVDCLF